MTSMSLTKHCHCVHTGVQVVLNHCNVYHIGSLTLRSTFLQKATLIVNKNRQVKMRWMN